MGADLFDRSLTTEASATHGSVIETLEDTATFSVHRITMQGDYDALKALRDGHYCNEVVTDTDLFLSDFQGCKGDKVIVSMQLSRLNGGRGELVVQVKLFQRGYEGGIDFETIQKDIIYWRQLCASNVPKLDEIQLWAQMKDDKATIPLYYEFKYLDSAGAKQEITDPATRKLAEMMARGVESYNEYVPTLTITYTLAAHPVTLGVQGFKAGALLGKVVESTQLTLDGQGFANPIGTISGGTSPVSDFESMYEGKILCTGDNLRCNSDGSYTLTRAFTKFRAIEPELYLNAGGEFGPYDTNQ